VPINARAIPTEQIRMNFQLASTEFLLNVSGIIKAEKIVVASIATHITPTLLADTAKSIEAMNKLKKIWNRRTCAGV
jgi:hypothetical protein